MTPLERGQRSRATVMLVLATVGFGVNFWAWSLISPLGGDYGGRLGLTGFQQSTLVAIPVLVGSLGRIPIGALTDKLGAKFMFPLVSVLTIVPVLFIAFVADSYAMMLLGGFFLGLGGTTFAIGVPFVSSWYPVSKRGAALGIFGMGTAGTAVSAFTTVPLADAFGREAPFVLVSVILAIYAVASYLLLRESPDRPEPTGSFIANTVATMRLGVTWQLAALYALGFGGFVAFSVYLPTYLVNAYGLTGTDASFRTAVFVILAVIARPVGGALSDRVGAIKVLLVSFVATGVFAAIDAIGLPLVPIPTAAFLGMAATLGAASGATFALVGQVAPPNKVGSVTGVVGAAGGLGGFVPPLVMGATYDALGNYTLGYALLALVAFGMAAFTWGPVRTAARRRAEAAAASESSGHPATTDPGPAAPTGRNPS
ncbi:NarK/NasA family nitrate transporter [Occultella glacieicola]|uniref:NarK/NasA family nitrate transporter n=1 Tax=Occultella glacieicola TaxID=2518684 RepID=A0ABY2DZT8_9MICO|nr:MFS transporter [Occultella glacieicola]TDE88878.1 NarK/NasA family nitrate transporter [Occultella glacieicola]